MSECLVMSRNVGGCWGLFWLFYYRLWYISAYSGFLAFRGVKMGSKKKVQESGYLNMRSKNIRFLKDIALPH